MSSIIIQPINIMNKVGRPPKYQDDTVRLEIRRNQNRINKRLSRKRKKILEELNTLRKPNYSDYRSNIINYFSRFDFDYFLTGTVDLNKNERDELINKNNEIKYINNTYDTQFTYTTEKKIGVYSLRKYTERYINYLSDNKIVDRSFVFFEKGENNRYHVHILFKSNDQKINIENMLKKSWLIGISNIVHLKSEVEKNVRVGYFTKELNPTSNNKSDMNIVDNWFFSGDFETKGSEIKHVELKT